MCLSSIILHSCPLEPNHRGRSFPWTLRPDTLKTVGDIRGSPAQQIASSHSRRFRFEMPQGWAIGFPAPPPLPTQTHPTHPRHMDTVPPPTWVCWPSSFKGDASCWQRALLRKDSSLDSTQFHKHCSTCLLDCSPFHIFI